MKNSTKILKVIIINIIVLAVLLELVSAVVYLIKHKAFFYTDNENRKVDLAIKADVDRQLTDKRFHPFFGYTYKAAQTETNNYGFNCPYNVPLKRENLNWYIVGVFGGSVADDFYRLGTERLTQRLKQQPGMAEKEFIYLNFAMGGYKQPQQLQILTYFLSIGQELDLAINIDGFNEMVFCFNNNRLNLDMGMPSGQHILPLRDLMDSNAVTGEKLEAIWNIRKHKAAFNETQNILQDTPFASAHLILSVYAKNIYRKYREETLRFDKLIKPASPADSIVNVKYTKGNPDEDSLLTDVVSFWSRCSLLMSRAVEAQNGRYVHVLQPNQYFSQKTFTAEEQYKAVDRQGPYNYLVQKGYPSFIREVANLQSKSVNSLDATALFDKSFETLYIDNCCHFNQTGNQLLAEFIADKIAQNKTQ